MGLQDKDISRSKNGEAKSWLITKRYKQQHGVDYEEVLAPIARLDTIGYPLHLQQNRWKIY